MLQRESVQSGVRGDVGHTHVMKEELVRVRFDLNKRMVYLRFGRRRQNLQDDRDYHLINILSSLYENQGSWLPVYVPAHKGRRWE
jgi:hypothetical protein